MFAAMVDWVSVTATATLTAVPLLMSADEFGAYIQSEIVKWANVIKANKISVQ